MHVSKKEVVNQINFLASAKVQAFTYQADTNMVTDADDKGRKVLVAGSVYPSNDDKAVGIVYDDVDVTDGSQPVSVIVEGYILEKRLPVAPVAAAKTAMKEIKFR
ncbi:hypothetical protein DUK53_08690 [Listeria sp. SHR_NRA_18]|uniref:hypothetical protein n=1 Tax=Listeria sp. SHR_NRA_18 TaxID=2269046 RepID=UPI00051DC58C|nr:hypothetical protein [Listeria sp. SHR_NRA_18]KGL46043.1 hypothetical protein EP56_02915 [Listeriaceae bacterium FSL A5-0209]RQW66705.1 hypothetical protein DUK53_08690 [Listeria sp. SHR_NRA_18]